MMNNKNILLTGALLFTGLIIGITIYWHTLYSAEDFSCESQLTIMDRKTVYELLMSFTFRDGTGRYEATGQYRDQAGNTIKTSNQVTFDYWRKGKNIYLVSKNTNELPKTGEPAITWKPDFFRKRNRGITFQMVQENPEGYLFLYDNAPLFYCTLHNK